MRKILFLALIALTVASSLAPAYAGNDDCQGDEEGVTCSNVQNGQ
jgi:hypothetical protein